MKEEYDEYIKIADELKEKSEGVINLYKTGTIKRTALKLLDDNTKHITPEKIELDEALIIEDATSNGYQFFEEYNGEAFKGDIVSMYPSIYSSNNSLVPVKRGIFKKITDDDISEMKNKLKGGYAYGLYKYNIYRSGNYKIDRLFRFKNITTLDDSDDDDYDEKNFYTSIDLKIADMLGLKKVLITNCSINCVLYPRSSCLTGHQIFNDFVETLKPLKQEKIEGAKLLLNILSGAISQKNTTKLYVDEENGDLIDLDAMNLEVIDYSQTRDKTKSIYTCVNKTYFYSSQFARFKPFMLAQARLMMLNIILPINDIVKKCYIDSILTTKPIIYNNDFGKLKFEYYLIIILHLLFFLVLMVLEILQNH